MAGTSFRAWTRSTAKLGRRHVVSVVAWGLLDVLAACLQALLAGATLEHALTGQPAGRFLAWFAALAVCRAAAFMMAERAAFEAGAAARRHLRGEVMGRLLALGPALLREKHSGELAALPTDRIDALEGFFARWRPANILALASPALVLAVLLPRDPVAAGILALTGLLVPVGLALAGIGAKAATRGQFRAMERLQTRFLDRVRGIATIIALGAAARQARDLQESADELRRRTMAVLRVAFLSSLTLDLAAAAALVVLAVRMAASRTGLDLATLLLVPVFFTPLRGFAAAYQDRSHATAASEALAAVPEAPAPHAAPAGAPAVRTIQAHGIAVSFQDVTLRWDPHRPPALDHLSFRLAAGETLVLAGPSGSGKSSVISVLLGFVAPDSGRVRLNGLDLSTITPAALSRLVGWIGQRPTLFATTIGDNIRFARPEASDAELAEAVRAARLDRVLDSLPQGLATPIGEGGHGLSGGQAQRVAIARAFLRDAPLLLLDEPTSHLDPATEADVLDSLQRLAIGRTVILATHSAAARAFPGRRLDLRDGRAVTAEARGAA